VALVLKLGSTAFGGPAVHIALMQREVVERRRWLTREEFLDYLGLTNLIPGPNSTELAIHIGFVQRGSIGLIVAGLCFILPAALLTTAIGWAYVQYGALPEVRGLVRGLGPFVSLARGAKAGPTGQSLALALMPVTAGTSVMPLGLWPLFATFFKIGSVLFGSGYVLVAFLRNG
jgi:chromate transporter